MEQIRNFIRMVQGVPGNPYQKLGIFVGLDQIGVCGLLTLVYALLMIVVLVMYNCEAMFCDCICCSSPHCGQCVQAWLLGLICSAARFVWYGNRNYMKAKTEEMKQFMRQRTQME
ncbi:MAG: hypothetical protein MHMPM18_000084 [Marteilia pararefringens]